MHLGIRLIDKRGAILEAAEDPTGLLHTLPGRFDLPSSALPRHLDPIGDTTFNRIQAAHLLGELAGIRPHLAPKERQLIDRVIGLAERPEKGGHVYLVFIGD